MHRPVLDSRSVSLAPSFGSPLARKPFARHALPKFASSLVLIAGVCLPAMAQAKPPSIDMPTPAQPSAQDMLNDRIGPDQQTRAKALRSQLGIDDATKAAPTQTVAQVQGTPPPVTNCSPRTGKLYFRFNEANILDVLKQVSQYTCKNFIVSEGIKGAKKEITIISHRPVTVSQAYAAFESALEANGMALIPAGRFYKLVDRKDAVRDALPMY